jgi:hypothetical protein
MLSDFVMNFVRRSPRLETLRALVMFIVGVVGICLGVSAQSIGSQWHGLVALHSSRTDVEKLFGKPVRTGRYLSSYDLKEELVEIMYAAGPPCGATMIDSWRVPLDTVVSIKLYPKNVVLFVEPAGYVKTEDLVQTHVSYYSNESDGVRYTVERRDGRDYLSSIDYRPRAVDKHLQCATFSARDRPSPPFFEEYGNVSTVTERAILDNFAIQLTKDPNLTGYVVVYGERNLKTTRTRLGFIKRYLLKQRNVPADRLVARSSDLRREFTVRLYLASKGTPEPIPDNE